MPERYKVIAESVSGHCCFEASVVDTSKVNISINGRPMTNSDGTPYYVNVCECFDIAEAKMIAAALNDTA